MAITIRKPGAQKTFLIGVKCLNGNHDECRDPECECDECDPCPYHVELVGFTQSLFCRLHASDHEMHSMLAPHGVCKT